MPRESLSGNSQSSHSALMAQGLASQDAGYTQQFRYAFAFALYSLAAPWTRRISLGTLSPQGTPPKPTTLAKLGV